MKKLLLSFVALSFAAIGMAQVSFYVNPPSTNSGNYSVTFVDNAGGDWASPDLTDPNNAVEDDIVIVQGVDSLGCDPLTNGLDVNGKIAMVWRGDCQFGTKAWNAQNAGAIAVVIVNHSGEPVGMAGGDDGPNVTIPVVMISTSTGELIYDEIQAGGTVNVFIGNKFGYFANDIGIGQKDVLRAPHFATPADFAQDASEFEVAVGSWIYNYGQNDQTNVVLNCEITGAGVTAPYNNGSTAANIPSGDSLFVTLPTFSQATYAMGDYTVVYSVTSDAADDFIDDNALNADFRITEDEFSYARLDADDLPLAIQHFQPSGVTASFNSCIHFVNANASRRAAAGLTFNATATTDVSLEGTIIAVEAYSWDETDPAAYDLNDANFSLATLNNITIGEYEYLTDAQDSTITTIFDEPFVMDDNQHYLFCATSISTDVFLGYDNGLDYDENITLNGSPTSTTGNDGSFFGTGFGTDLSAAVALITKDPIWLGVEEEESAIEINAYPNPAVDMITIPLSNMSGMANLIVTDINGKIVLNQSVEIVSNKLTVDVTSFSAGQYVFSLNVENQKASTFTVVVSK